MEYTREIYWNVGQGAQVLVPMYLLTVVALVILGAGFWKRIKVYRQGAPLQRSDDLGGRISGALGEILSQAKVMRVPGAGSAHGLFFWGFFLLFLGTCLIVIQADFTDPLFGFKFLQGDFYLFFSLALDLAGAVALIMLAGLFVRRYLLRPEGLEVAPDHAVMHGLLFAILTTGFLIEGARMAATESGTALAWWSPLGLLFAQMFSGMDAETIGGVHSGLWWFHLLLALGFIAVIPFTRFRHIFTTSANYLFADRRSGGALSTLDLEDEERETFGASKISELTWKDLLDSDACTECKRCQDRCPAHATEKPLSPMQMVSRIRDTAFGNPDADLIEAVSRDALWSCTTCRACQEICPASVEHPPKIVEMRRNLVLMEGEFPGEEVMAAAENAEVNGNPLGMPFADRGEWARELGVKTLSEDSDIDVLYFVGCYGSFDRRNIQVAESFIKLCRAADVKVGILGQEEKCCGEPLRKLGNEYLYQMLAAENIETMKGYGVKKVVTTCPHCFNTLSKDWRDLGFDAEVEHYTLFLDRLLKSGKLQVSEGEAFDCTYHDSCYLGRHNDIYQAPRDLIRSVGARIVEMENNGDESFCCGAGGGRILAEEKLGTRIAEKRAEMAADTGASQLVSNCPFCLTMFEDGIKGGGHEERIKPRDIAEILVERLIEENPSSRIEEMNRESAA